MITPRLERLPRRSAVAMALAILLVGPAEALGPEAEVETLSGVFRGRLETLDATAAVMLVDGSPRRLPVDEVVSIRFERRSAAAVADAGQAVLVDGSVVQHERWALDGDRLVFASGRDAAPMSAEAPLAAVRAWRLPGEPESAGAFRQWDLLAERRAPADVLVVRGRDGAEIDYVEGVVQGCDADGVRFAFDTDGEAVAAPWRRVFGILFCREPAPLARPIVVHGERGSRLHAARVELDGGALRLAGGAATIVAPLDRVSWVDLSVGKVQRLGDAELLRSDWRPYFEGPAAQLLGGPPRRNRAYDGGPLRLLFADPRSPGLRVARSFASGWAIRSRGEVELRLEPWARRLRGWVGVDPATAASGSAEVTIEAGGRDPVRLVVSGAADPIAIDADVAGADSLRIVVDFGENLDTGDNIHFADVRVTR